MTLFLRLRTKYQNCATKETYKVSQSLANLGGRRFLSFFVQDVLCSDLCSVSVLQ